MQPELPSSDSLLKQIENCLENEGVTEDSLQPILDQTLKYFRCVVGTIHSLAPTSNMLQLRAQRGIPDAIFKQVSLIPIGKGMAGLAASRREPVQVCNLQSDDTGVAKQGAKETQMEGSIAVPMLVEEKLRGAMGIAKPEPYEFSKDEIQLLLQIASLVGKYFS